MIFNSVSIHKQLDSVTPCLKHSFNQGVDLAVKWLTWLSLDLLH